MNTRIYSMHVPGIIKVIGANVAAYSVTLTEVNEWLKTISILVAIGYTIYRWRSDIKTKKSDS